MAWLGYKIKGDNMVKNKDNNFVCIQGGCKQKGLACVFCQSFMDDKNTLIRFI